MMQTTSELQTAASRPPVGGKINLFFLIGILVAVAGFVLPWVGLPRNLMSLLTSATITAILATGVGFLVRQAGLTSFGHAAFYGGAAYLVGLLLAYTAISVEVVLLIAPFAIFGAAFILAFVLLRTSGVAYSMLSLAVAQALYELMMRWREIANGEDGLRVRFPREVFGFDIMVFQRAETMFVVVWAILIAVVVGLSLLTQSRFGTLTIAIKNNEERARFIGYRTLVPRALIIAISALVAALGGTLFALYYGYVTPDILHWSLSGEALIIAIIGGTRSVWGPALGAFLFVCLRDVVSDYTTHWQSIVGITLIIIVLTAPNGISGGIRTLWAKAKGGTRG